MCSTFLFALILVVLDASLWIWGFELENPRVYGTSKPPDDPYYVSVLVRHRQRVRLTVPSSTVPQRAAEAFYVVWGLKRETVT